jgi:uncharacterized protein with HEPN domain
MTSKDFRIFLNDIDLYCSKTSNFVIDKTFEEFIGDEKILLSVIRCLEVIGEASKHIPLDIKNLYPEISWKVIAGMRDYLIHDYKGINNNLVWKTATEDIPILQKGIKAIIHDYE